MHLFDTNPSQHQSSHIIAKNSYTSDRGTITRKSSALGLGKPNPASSSSLVSDEMSALNIDSMAIEPPDSDYDDDENDRGGRRKDHGDLSFTIVWSPLPVITWLIPFIGHTGICDSKGIASDFRGPYYVGDDGHMAFGAPTRSLKITGVTAEAWDDAIRIANGVYQGRMHNICCDNCHSHVAYALNSMDAQAYGVAKWDMVKIAILIFFRGRFLSWSAILQQFLPCTLIVVIWLILR